MSTILAGPNKCFSFQTFPRQYFATYETTENSAPFQSLADYILPLNRFQRTPLRPIPIVSSS